MAFVANTLNNLPVTSGSVFFVDSGASRAADGNAGRDPSVPMATIDAAVGRCTANNGDMIVVMPGHSESPTSSIALDVAGVWVYGLGWGASRPTITFEALAATCAMSADSTRISNLRFTLGATTATVTNAVVMSGDYCVMEDCEVQMHVTSQFTDIVAVTGDYFIIKNNHIRALNSASSATGIKMTTTLNGWIEGNFISGHFGSTAAIDDTAASGSTRVMILHNFVKNFSSTAGDLAIALDDASIGYVAENDIVGGLALASNVDFGNSSCIENYVTDAADVSAVLIPATAAT